jgi:DmsE family decaheme c-type cytochrome
MTQRYKFFLLLLVAGSLMAVSSLVPAGRAYAQDNFKLKPGARGKICLGCHVDFEDKLKNPFVHTPVRTGECTGCHSPHASSHGKMLAADVTKICYRCHKAIVPENAVSAHKVVVEGGCVKCHDPHSAKNKFNLLKQGNELCFGCHKELGEKTSKEKFKHAPVASGCINCHNPHGSDKAEHLLVNSVPSLCLGCHQATNPIFMKQHMNYPVAKARCTTCHDPHGSNRGGILYDDVHPPVASRMCDQCHEEPTSPNPFARKKPGYELCRGCHSNLVNDILSKNKMHWPVLSKKGCLTCHSPHASPQPKLLKDNMISLCGTCHKDTIARQERSETKHPPIQKGMCMACHVPHSSDNNYLLNKPSVIDLCGTCHDWQKHSTHPIGPKVTDPRNKNLTLMCLSCHRSHGTENKNFIYTPVVSDMCTGCHVQFKR